MDDLVIREGEHWRLSQAENVRIPGYLIVENVAWKTRFAELTPEEGVELTEILSIAEQILTRILEPERVYVLRFGEEVEGIHFHVVPRTRALLDAYLASVEDSPPYTGAKIVLWAWENHPTLGVVDSDIRDFVAAAREEAARKTDRTEPSYRDLVPVFHGSYVDVVALQAALGARGLTTFIPNENIKVSDPFITGANALEFNLMAPEEEAVAVREAIREFRGPWEEREPEPTPSRRGWLLVIVLMFGLPLVTWLVSLLI
jgi:diadenosine tetraphosphate (Ap4A) HIT family hydrolase